MGSCKVAPMDTISEFAIRPSLTDSLPIIFVQIEAAISSILAKNGLRTRSRDVPPDLESVGWRCSSDMAP